MDLVRAAEGVSEGPHEHPGSPWGAIFMWHTGLQYVLSMTGFYWPLECVVWCLDDGSWAAPVRLPLRVRGLTSGDNNTGATANILYNWYTLIDDIFEWEHWSLVMMCDIVLHKPRLYSCRCEWGASRGVTALQGRPHLFLYKHYTRTGATWNSDVS